MHNQFIAVVADWGNLARHVQERLQILVTCERGGLILGRIGAENIERLISRIDHQHGQVFLEMWDSHHNGAQFKVIESRWV